MSAPERTPVRTWTRDGVRHDRDCWERHPVCALRAARALELARREHHAGRARRLEEAATLATRPGGPATLEQKADIAVEVSEARRELLTKRLREQGR